MKGPFENHFDAETLADLANRLARQRTSRRPRRDPQIVEAAQAAAEIRRKSVPEREGGRVGVADDIERQHRHRCGTGPRLRAGRRRLHASVQRVELGTQRGGRLVPIVGMLREQRVDDALQLRRMVRRQLPHRHMRLELDGRAERAPRQDVERTGAGGHLIEHRAKGKEIAPVVDRGGSRQLLG